MRAAQSSSQRRSAPKGRRLRRAGVGLLALGITVAAFAIVPSHASAQATNFILPAGTGSATSICTGADADTNTLLDAFGFNNLPVDQVITSDAVDSVDQGGDQPFSFHFATTLSQTLVAGSVALNVTSLQFDNATGSMTATAGATGDVAGTSSVGVPLGDGSAAVTYNTGPFTGTVNRTGAIGDPITFVPGVSTASITPFSGDMPLLPQPLNVICTPGDIVPLTVVDVEGTTTTTESTASTSTTRPPANTTTTVGGNTTASTVAPVPQSTSALARTGGFHMELFLVGLGLLGAGAIMSGAGQRAARASTRRS